MANKNFKVTIEYVCKEMIDEDSLEEEFSNNPMEAYKMISDNFKDSIFNFTNDEGNVIKVEVIN